MILGRKSDYQGECDRKRRRTIKNTVLLSRLPLCRNIWSFCREPGEAPLQIDQPMDSKAGVWVPVSIACCYSINLSPSQSVLHALRQFSRPQRPWVMKQLRHLSAWDRELWPSKTSVYQLCSSAWTLRCAERDGG